MDIRRSGSEFRKLRKLKRATQWASWLVAKHITEKDKHVKELTANSENKTLYLKVTMEFLVK
jgi:hypothetical protein